MGNKGANWVLFDSLFRGALVSSLESDILGKSTQGKTRGVTYTTEKLIRWGWKGYL